MSLFPERHNLSGAVKPKETKTAYKPLHYAAVFGDDA